MKKIFCSIIIFCLCLTGCIQTNQSIQNNSLQSSENQSKLNSSNEKNTSSYSNSLAIEEIKYMDYCEYFKKERKIEIISSLEHNKDGIITYFQSKSGFYQHPNEIFYVNKTNDFLFFCDEKGAYRYFIKEKILDKLVTWEELNLNFDEVLSCYPLSNYAFCYGIYSDSAKELIKKGLTPFTEDFQEPVYDNVIYNSKTKELSKPVYNHREIIYDITQ